MIRQGDQEKRAGQHSLNVSFPDYFSVSAPVAFLHQRKSSICVGLNWILTSFSLMLHSRLVSQTAVAWKSTFKSYIILLFSCCPPWLPHLPAMSLLSSRHIFCFCICRGNNSDGRRDLPADLLIIHHSLFVATVRSGWVSSNLRI